MERYKGHWPSFPLQTQAKRPGWEDMNLGGIKQSFHAIFCFRISRKYFWAGSCCLTFPDDKLVDDERVPSDLRRRDRPNRRERAARVGESFRFWHLPAPGRVFRVCTKRLRCKSFRKSRYRFLPLCSVAKVRQGWRGDHLWSRKFYTTLYLDL